MEIKINKEIRDYKEAVFFGLSMRQFIFSLIACGVAVLLYFLLRNYLGLETLSWVCILGAIPFGILGFVRYNGMNAEQFIWAWIKSEILMPKVLLFKPENIYYKYLKPEYKKIEKETMKNEVVRCTKKETGKREDTNSNECAKSNTNKEDIRKWNISSWME